MTQGVSVYDNWSLISYIFGWFIWDRLIYLSQNPNIGPSFIRQGAWNATWSAARGGKLLGVHTITHWDGGIPDCQSAYPTAHLVRLGTRQRYRGSFCHRCRWHFQLYIRLCSGRQIQIQPSHPSQPSAMFARPFPSACRMRVKYAIVVLISSWK